MVGQEYGQGATEQGSPYPEIEQVLYSPQLANNIGTFMVDLNCGINIAKISALNPAITLYSVGNICLLTDVGPFVSVA